VYAGVAALVLLLSYSGDGAFGDPGGVVLVLLYAAWLAGTIGATCGALAGFVGGLVLWGLAELRCRRRTLVLAGCVAGALLGVFGLDLARAIGTAPDDGSLLELLLWRAGPAAAGALGATWQAGRVRHPPPGPGDGRGRLASRDGRVVGQREQQ
jgi:hypothetical protein